MIRRFADMTPDEQRLFMQIAAQLLAAQHETEVARREAAAKKNIETARRIVAEVEAQR